MNLAKMKEYLYTIRGSGLNPALYVVIGESDTHLVVRHRFTGEIKVLGREGGAHGKVQRL